MKFPTIEQLVVELQPGRSGGGGRGGKYRPDLLDQFSTITPLL